MFIRAGVQPMPEVMCTRGVLTVWMRYTVGKAFVNVDVVWVRSFDIDDAAFCDGNLDLVDSPRGLRE